LGIKDRIIVYLPCPFSSVTFLTGCNEVKDVICPALANGFNVIYLKNNVRGRPATPMTGKGISFENFKP